MFLKKKLSKTAKNTIVKNYGQLKGGGQAQGPPPKYATGHDRIHNDRSAFSAIAAVPQCRPAF